MVVGKAVNIWLWDWIRAGAKPAAAGICSAGITRPSRAFASTGGFGGVTGLELGDTGANVGKVGSD